MIDLRALRDDPDAYRDSQRKRGASADAVDALLVADAEHRSALQSFETLRAEQKGLGKRIAGAGPDEKQALLARTKTLAEEVKAAESKVTATAAAFDAAGKAIPNLVADEAPAGGEDDYVVLREVGEKNALEDPKDHLELGTALGLLDTERGAKTSGARFYYLTGDGAMLQLAMLNLAMQQAVETGFTPMIPPVLVRPDAMEGTGFLGEHADEIYYLERDDMYLVGTSEVPLAAYHSGENLGELTAPRRYAGWSSCFRREAGSYGKDTRGIIRVHQFDKVEMFSFCRPEDAAAEHEKLLSYEEQMLQKMELPYRVIDVAAGDLGTSASRKFDCEAWVPTQGRYRELTSTSNCTTFQARRLNVKYRDEQGRNAVAATLNGTLATTRWLVAILENHQRPDGSVAVPKALQPYLGKDVLEPKQ
ncbi:serine--tRNA ligase [Glycomyces sp. TRM65418]|uniref:serine--tRNA ligase n=1 Tax=Glycomyces sp. TRM65418 TaxID=2867006 RepID=UPI001CE5EF01|nr:serine--tRNA ligase [Glycomyces sp. TRM65418]MCC3764017.1 serine--tRNA ligase [Glycomyces sp. TRM65418]QZD53709.1 serine--tRNA ligase [Glycomyces sp. TRM65418]